MDVSHLSLSSLHIGMYLKGDKLADGTASVFHKNNKSYLVTAWHCLTGTNPYSLKSLSTKGTPDTIIVTAPILRNQDGNALLDWGTKEFNLYQNNQAAWLVHPMHGSTIDVAVLPIPTPPANSYFSPVIRDSPNMLFNVGDELTINGFMFGNEMFPTWKKASLASEPLLTHNKDKLFYSVDTSTREGLSGSPAYIISKGEMVIQTDTGESKIITSQNKIFHKFLGVYSGRRWFRNKEEAQIGIIWPRYLIDEIIEGKVHETMPSEWTMRDFPTPYVFDT